MLPLFDTTTLDELRTLARDVGPAPDDPQLALNWSFHSRSDDYKVSLKRLLPLAQPALDRAFTDHVAYLTTFITKWPGANGAFPPHQDPTLIDERRFTGVTVWAPLDDVDVRNGMLHVVPGSHRFSKALRLQDVDTTPFAGLEQEILEHHGRGVPLDAGEALVFDNRLLHFSLPNVSEGPRLVLSFGMRPQAGRCTVVLPVGDDQLGIHEVDDDFYVDVLPASRDHWRPTAPPVAVVPRVDEAWTAEHLAALCAAAGEAPRAEVVTLPDDVHDGALDTGVFCALCGSTEGLTTADRSGRDNAQLRCPDCEASLAAVRAHGG